MRDPDSRDRQDRCGVGGTPRCRRRRRVRRSRDDSRGPPHERGPRPGDLDVRGRWSAHRLAAPGPSGRHVPAGRRRDLGPGERRPRRGGRPTVERAHRPRHPAGRDGRGRRGGPRVAAAHPGAAPAVPRRATRGHPARAPGGLVGDGRGRQRLLPRRVAGADVERPAHPRRGQPRRITAVLGTGDRARVGRGRPRRGGRRRPRRRDARAAVAPGRRTGAPAGALVRARVRLSRPAVPHRSRPTPPPR